MRRFVFLCLCVASLGNPMAKAAFVDRTDSQDVRMLTYNVFFDHNFPDTSMVDAAKFERIVSAVRPDIINLQEIYNHSASQLVDLLNSVAPLPDGDSWYAYQGGDNITASKYPLSMMRNRPVPAGDRRAAMLLVDLPDALHARDLYLMNNHYKCCGGFDTLRQRQSDALVNWMRDARSAGEFIDLPGMTPMMVVGDLNIVESLTPLNTLLTGDILDNGTYGPDSAPDWDGSPLTDSRPLHNDTGPDDYTWRDDSSIFEPGVLDFVIFSDSAATVTHQYVLNTTLMTAAELDETGLELNDVVLSPANGRFDHLPLVTDFQTVSLFQIADLDANGVLNSADLALLENAAFSSDINLRFDIDGDADIDEDDIRFWLFDVFDTLPGDANLDRLVDGQDFLIWNSSKFQSESSWLAGDFTFDGVVDGQDFLIWNDHKFTNAAASVPETTPSALLVAGFLCVSALIRSLSQSREGV